MSYDERSALSRPYDEAQLDRYNDCPEDFAHDDDPSPFELDHPVLPSKTRPVQYLDDPDCPF